MGIEEQRKSFIRSIYEPIKDDKTLIKEYTSIKNIIKDQAYKSTDYAVALQVLEEIIAERNIKVPNSDK